MFFKMLRIAKAYAYVEVKIHKCDLKDPWDEGLSSRTGEIEVSKQIFYISRVALLWKSCNPNTQHDKKIVYGRVKHFTIETTT